MSEHLTVIVELIAKEGCADNVKAEISEIIPHARLEEGFIEFLFYEDIQNKNRIVIYEIWESFRHWQNHLQKPHFLKYRYTVAEYLVQRSISQFAKINA